MAKFILVGLFGLSLALRVIGLGNYPAGFNPDEAAYGYNAYSLLLTGRDEWGAPWYSLWSANLRSFGDYRYPLYAFLTVPSIWLLGLNEFSTRLPNALIGSLAPLAVYLLARRLVPSRPGVGLFSALLLTVSPWAISLSRGAFETNLPMLFFPLAIYSWLSGRRYLAALLFGINFYSYLAARYLTPLIVLALCTAYKKVHFTSLILLVILVLPGVISTFTVSNARVSDVGIFSPTDNWHEIATRRFDARNTGLPDVVARLASNKLIYLASLFVKNYLSYFSNQFLFTYGPAESNYGIMTGRGLLYYVQLPLLLIALYQGIRHPNRSLKLLLILILLAPIPAALAKGPGYAANRAALMAPLLAVLSALGLPKSKKTIAILLVFLVASHLYFLEDYFFHSTPMFARGLNYGMRELVQRTLPQVNQYPVVQVSRSLSEPHIYFAFYSRTPPAVYQRATRDWSVFSSLGYKFLDQYDGYYLGKLRFGNITPSQATTQPTLFIGRPDDFPSGYPEYFHLDYPDGQTAITVAHNQP